MRLFWIGFTIKQTLSPWDIRLRIRETFLEQSQRNPRWMHDWKSTRPISRVISG